MSWVLYLVHAIFLPPLTIGLVRAGKARLQNRQGPSPLQPWWDMCKLLRKGETISGTTTWIFRAAPLASATCALAAALMTPWLGLRSPLYGDLFLLIYVLALGKFAISLAAMDAGSAFGALGASREAAVSIQSEPAMVLALAALALQSRSSALAVMLAPGHTDVVTVVLVPVVLVALGLAAVAEMARMPVDDPTTHLELTMIHEALILENSGRNLAIVEYAAGLKMVLLLGLMGQVVLRPGPVPSPLLAYVLSLGCILAGVLAVVVAESTLVKLRWRRIPNLLSFALLAGALACLLVALKG